MNRLTAQLSARAASISNGEIKAILLKSLALSLMAHLLMFQVFVFTFPLHPADPKPHFVFLGAVLNPQEVTVWPLENGASSAEEGRGMSPGMENGDRKFVYEYRDMSGGPFQIPAGEKPLATKTVDFRGKVTMKTTFLAPRDKGDAPAGLPPEMMSGHEPSSYKPLRLSP